MSTHLYFSFGPVQSFVAQARRTRDLFSGSFLLSHLALVALRAAKHTADEILLPNLDTLENLVASGAKHAGAPNRFVAKFSDEDAAARAAAAATDALKTEWKTIANAVWEKFVAPAATFSANNGTTTAEIWERQIENFWEISWAIGGESENDLLDRRKNWRTPPITIEGGDHCSLMGEWQELSGFIRSQERSEQEVFWTKLRTVAEAATHNTLNLDPDERLCAIALIKRFFPDVAKSVIGRNLDATKWPSTVDIAVAPWRRKIADNPQAAIILREFPEFAAAHAGNFLNRTALENERDTPLEPDRRKKLKAMLSRLEKLTDDRGGNFYALLLMDGDRMGKLIREHGPRKVTAALTEFSAKTPAIVEKHGGECVYAGGDDLLALLPLDSALNASATVRSAYLNAFENNAATISASVVFAHYRVPLRRVLRHAHQRLDDDAKEATGRDAIAISVLKPGGETCRWVAKFSKFLDNDSNCFKALTDRFRDDGDALDMLSS